MSFRTNINGLEIVVPEYLIEKYDKALPRYTSYPTAPVWKELKDNVHIKSFRPLSLYFHIPFCNEKCAFCGCSSITTSKKDVIEKYVSRLSDEIRAASNENSVVQIHFGGGSPAILDVSEFERIFSSIKSSFHVEKNAEVSIEASPSSISPQKVEELSQIGFNRISLGIQDLNTKVQNSIGRVEKYDQIKTVVLALRQNGFQSINFDVVYGFPHQTVENFSGTIEKLVKLEPDRLACFNFAYLPKAIPNQRKIDGSKIPGRDEKFKIFCRTLEVLCSSGYNLIGMDHFAKKSDELSKAAGNKTLWRNFQGYTTKAGTDLIGFGLTAISDIGGYYLQNTKKLSEYFSKIESGEKAAVKGWRLSEDDLKTRNVIRNLFCFFEAEADPGTIAGLKELQEDGLIESDKNLLKVKPLGKLFIRNIASKFDKYLSKTENVFSRSV